MSANRLERVEWTLPQDNVQRFETVRRQAEFLQDMGDLDEDIDSINELTKSISLEGLAGLQVALTGGKIQVPAIDAQLDAPNCFVDNNRVKGQYRGLTWRKVESDILPGSYQWYLCHVLLTGTDSYNDDQGNHHTIENYSYVTASTSEIGILTVQGSHDYRRLANDGFSIKLDELAIDENKDIDEKLRCIATMFDGLDKPQMTEDETTLRRQRLSYLNELQLFRGFVCLSPYAYVRDATDAFEMKVYGSDDSFLSSRVLMAGLDFPAQPAPDRQVTIDTHKQSFCLEAEIQGIGVASIPYVPGFTKLFDFRP